MTISTKTKVNKLRDKINKCVNEIKELQNSCKHPQLVGKYKSNTGNWCDVDNDYWVDFHCPDCDKVWYEDQSDISFQNKQYVSKEGYTFMKE